MNRAAFFWGLLMGIESELRISIRFLSQRYAPVHQAAAADYWPYVKGIGLVNDAEIIVDLVFMKAKRERKDL